MSGWSSVLHVLTLVLACTCASAQTAQHYPAKPIRMLSAQFGGGSDIAARLIAGALSPRLGQQVVVDSRVGGTIIAETAMKAAPDGYTIVCYSGTLWVLPLMQAKPAYDPFRDFAPVTLVGSAPMVVAVHPSVPAKSIGELIALAKAKPGELNSATGPLGATPHLASELLKYMAGIDIVHVAYRGVGAAVNDLVSGRVQMMMPNAGAVLQHVKMGKLRVLAVGSAKPSVFFPGVPTVAESGLSGYEAVASYAVFAPARTPAALLTRLNQEIVSVLHTADLKEKFFNTTTDVIGSTPAQLTAHMKAEVARLGKVIKAADIRAE
jgi:tripartite-type tricarboxylate transporter receptor subunit TctC